MLIFIIVVVAVTLIIAAVIDKDLFLYYFYSIKKCIGFSLCVFIVYSIIKLKFIENAFYYTFLAFWTFLILRYLYDSISIKTSKSKRMRILKDNSDYFNRIYEDRLNNLNDTEDQYSDYSDKNDTDTDYEYENSYSNKDEEKQPEYGESWRCFHYNGGCSINHNGSAFCSYGSGDGRGGCSEWR